MVRKLLAPVLLVGALVWAAPAMAAVWDQLQAAALTAGDLGEGFTSVQAGPSETSGMATYMTVFMRMPSVRNPSLEVVATILVDITDAGPIDDADFAAAFARGLPASNQSGVELQPVEAPVIGGNTLRYAAVAKVAGQALTGDMLVWRKGSVVAAVFALGTNAPTALDYALTQQARLDSMFGQ